MAFFTEFYLTTVWNYKPNVVRQILDDLAGMGLTHAEFTYDREYRWFKVTCLEEHAGEIRTTFATLAREIEDKAFDTYEDDMLEMDDTLRPVFDHEWFTQTANATSSCKSDESAESRCNPEPLAEDPGPAMWDDLDKNSGNERYTAFHIMTSSERDQIQGDLGVKLSASLSGKIVYITGQSNESIRKAQDRFRVLLTMEKLRPSCLIAKHLVYAEDYVYPYQPDRIGIPEITADLRYLANIDPKLASSTLLDRVSVNKLEESYKTIYRQAASIRLCPWSPQMGCPVSLLGPKVSVGHKDRTTLGNRPLILTRSLDQLTLAADEPTLPAQRGATKTTDKVESWIEAVEAPAGTVTDTARSMLNAQATGMPLPAPPSEDLIDLDEEPSAPHRGPALGASAGDAETTLLDDDSPIPSLSQDFSALRVKPGTSGAEMVSSSLLKEPETGHEYLVDMLAAVATPVRKDASRPSVNWKMASLVPPPKDTEGNGTSIANWDEYLSVLEKSPKRSGNAERPVQKNQCRPRQATPTKKDGIGLPSGGSLAQPADKRQRPAQHVEGRNTSRSDAYQTALLNPISSPSAPGQVLATEAFAKEVEGAMAKVLSMGPYIRGRLLVRAELGRIILETDDVSGLAFNNAGKRSNGWRESVLIERLNHDFGNNKNIHFTKILSTFARDMEDMVSMTANGARLWEENPNRAWTTYSFHCSLNAAHKLHRFIVDIEDNGAATGFSYSIRLPNGGSDRDELMPLYIHAIRRHWDLRIAMSHAMPQNESGAYDSLATSLLQSLSVSVTGKGLPLLSFAVKKDFPVAVNEIRVLTKWRHASLSDRSALEITEVQQMEMVPCSEGVYSSWGDSWEGKLARPWSAKRIKDNRGKGEFPRWYEATVVSLELDMLCQQNTSLRVGEKANWDVENLRSRGVFSTLYGPALQMVAQMDHVGRLDDNNLSEVYGHLLKRPNNASHQVPGSAPTQSGQRNCQQRGGGRSSATGSEAWSAQGSTTSARGASSARLNPGAPAWNPDGDQYKFW
ncbi:hypothetical protein N658DRAFT_559452 [Parathielavia hyrcaniae]|uniref:Uncharacterized protein n=1 Tax=Parathielavia hyrcaniae TaxID=113614 RepID=A0AAN6PZ54_9PEZI|nr:hypothetical protein N658DRAFT_559452 [Parathielavia hyrcaniae]